MKALHFLAQHRVFTAREFAGEIVSRTCGQRGCEALLRYHLLTGRLVRLRRGLYAVVPASGRKEDLQLDPLVIASKASRDAVIGYQAALHCHGVASGLPKRIHYFSATRGRPFVLQRHEYQPVLGRGRVLNAAEERWLGGEFARVTSLERTVADVFDAPDRGGGWREIWRSLSRVEALDLDAVIKHAKAIDSAVACARLGYFLERQGVRLGLEKRHLEALRRFAPREPRYLDPDRRPGSFISAWNLVVPEEIVRLTSQVGRG